MGFQTPQHDLGKFLEWTNDGTIQLPDFQRGYKWEDERVRSLLVTILRGHPLGVVMLLHTGNDQIRFKPRPVAGASVPAGTEPAKLLLDGQQRLTSLTQALSGDGVVATMDSRGKLQDRRYYVHIATALEGEDRMDDAVRSVPGDGVVRSNFGQDIDLDLSTEDKERAEGYFPLRLLCRPLEAATWLTKLPDPTVMAGFMAEVLTPAGNYRIPAIELDAATKKSAVATVFEKVNTGGLPLTVFELLTSTFAGDRDYFDQHGTDFRLNDDWEATRAQFAAYPALANLESTDFLQAVSLLTTLERNRAHTGPRPPAVSAKREDVLKLELDDYLAWVDPLRKAFEWASGFLADLHIFDTRFLPYPKQLVPLAAIKVVLGSDADLPGVKKRLVRWFWSGILGELYGGAIETRFVRDVEQVPAWAREAAGAAVPYTITDAAFVESRLHSLRTRNAAAYKGIYALTLAGAKDWLVDKSLDKVQYVQLAVDIHHIFPKAWCEKNKIDDERRESIVNKTGIAAATNRSIGGAAPSAYTKAIEKRAKTEPADLDVLLLGHRIDPVALRMDDFDAFFEHRREQLCLLVESAMGKAVQRDVADGGGAETSDQFDAAAVAETYEETVDEVSSPVADGEDD